MRSPVVLELDERDQRIFSHGPMLAVRKGARARAALRPELGGGAPGNIQREPQPEGRSRLLASTAVSTMAPMRLLWLTVAFMAVGLLTACGTPEPTPTPTPTAVSTPTPTLSPAAPNLTGRVRVEYIPSADPFYSEYAAMAKRDRLLEPVADALNRAFAWPEDLTLSLGECGEPNAFYLPTERQIVVCWELVDAAIELFLPFAEIDEELVVQLTLGALNFFLYHELGHALIDILHLPAVGKEEDAADQVATLILLDSEDGGIALDGLDAAIGFFFIAGSQAGGIQDLAFWDEHSLDLQRAYNMACLAYGYDPMFFADYVESGVLPPERAQGCEQEYTRAFESWMILLEPHGR